MSMPNSDMAVFGATREAEERRNGETAASQSTVRFYLPQDLRDPSLARKQRSVFARRQHDAPAVAPTGPRTRAQYCSCQAPSVEPRKATMPETDQDAPSVARPADLIRKNGVPLALQASRVRLAPERTAWIRFSTAEESAFLARLALQKCVERRQKFLQQEVCVG